MLHFITAWIGLFVQTHASEILIAPFHNTVGLGVALHGWMWCSSAGNSTCTACQGQGPSPGGTRTKVWGTVRRQRGRVRWGWRNKKRLHIVLASRKDFPMISSGNSRATNSRANLCCNCGPFTDYSNCGDITDYSFSFSTSAVECCMWTCYS